MDLEKRPKFNKNEPILKLSLLYDRFFGSILTYIAQINVHLRIFCYLLCFYSNYIA